MFPFPYIAALMQLFTVCFLQHLGEGLVMKIFTIATTAIVATIVATITTTRIVATITTTRYCDWILWASNGANCTPGRCTWASISTRL